MNIFITESGFCGDCGSILPLLKASGDIICYTCSRRYSVNVFESYKTKFTINFNSIEARKKNKHDEKMRKAEEKAADEGPVVERNCPKCGNNKMSYATIQLRSADEGQTVFYTCTKCKFKESENS